MALITITVNVDESKLSAIDQLAEQMHLGRNNLLDEAVGNYLYLQEQQRASIERSLRQADAGQLIPHIDSTKHGRFNCSS